MDGRKFLIQLSEIYRDFDPESTIPKGDRFEEIQVRLNSNLSANFMRLLNNAVSCLEAGEIYCEIASNLGASLIGAAIDNPEVMAYTVSEFSDSDTGEQIEKLNRYLAEFDLQDRVCLYEGNYESFFQDLRELESEERIGVFYCDTLTDYRSVLRTLMLAKKNLASEAFIIIANTDLFEVKQAIEDFKSFHSSQQVHQLLSTTSESESPLNLGQEIIILLWQDSLDNLVAKRINKQGLIKLNQLIDDARKILLHVGCGPYREDALPEDFSPAEWAEIRLDIDPLVKPDIIGSITDLSAVPDNSIDAVYSSHNLEHIYDVEVPSALAEFKRVLKPNGFVMIRVPDLQIVGEWLIRGEIAEPPIYQSPAGPISAIDMLYGLRKSLAIGNYYMAHKTGFTADSFQKKLLDSGFKDLNLIRRDLEIVACGYK